MVEVTQVYERLRAVYPAAGAWWPVDQAYHEANGTDWRFEVCVGAILTQNTAWANVERALANLKDKRLLDPKRMSRADPAAVAEAVRPAGYYNQKTQYLRTFARHVANRPGGLDELFRGTIKQQRDLLLSFTGIGEETADDILVYASRVPSFIVDAYTRRLTKRLGLGSGQETYANLQSVWTEGLPPSAKHYGEAHALIVEHCKRTCTAKMPLCPRCPLEDICQQVGVEPEVYRRLP